MIAMLSSSIIVTSLEFMLLLALALIAVATPFALKAEGYRQRIAREKDGLAAEQADRSSRGAHARESASTTLENAVFELVGVLRGCSYTLRVLSGENEPISFETLLKKVWLKQQSHNDMNLLPGSAIRSVLKLLQGPGFVRMDRRVFSITELGRALCQRIEKVSRNSTVKEAPRPPDHSCGQKRDDMGLNGQTRNRAIAGGLAV